MENRGARRRRSRRLGERVLLAALVVPVVTAGLVAGVDLAPVGSVPVAQAATVLGRVTNGGGRCLENLNNGTAVNNTIRINGCSTAPAQQWSRWADESLKASNGRCIEPAGRSHRDGTAVVLVGCSGASHQKWVSVAGLLLNRATSKCLQYQGANVNGSRASIAACNMRATAQRWTVPALSTPTPTTPPPPPPPVTTTTVRPPTTTTTVPPVPTTAIPLPPGTTTTVLPPPPGSTTTVPPPTTGTPRPFVPVGSTEWRADLSKADVVAAGFRNNSWNRQMGDGVWNSPDLPWPIRIAAAPAGRAGRAVPFTLPNNGQRLEVEPNHRTFYEGDDYYFGISFHLDPAFPLATKSWQVFEQLKAAPSQGSPPVGFEVANGGLIMSGGYNKPGAASPEQFAYYRRLADLQVGRWYNMIYHVTFSSTSENSFVDVWLDGQKVVENFSPPGATVYTAGTSDDRVGTYRKQGLYHDPTIPGGTISMAGQKLGTGYTAADPTK